jgi:hypothetical protein
MTLSLTDVPSRRRRVVRPEGVQSPIVLGPAESPHTDG